MSLIERAAGTGVIKEVNLISSIQLEKIYEPFLRPDFIFGPYRSGVL
jgi:hypothetical protein